MRAFIRKRETKKEIRKEGGWEDRNVLYSIPEM
jgi:hypothetical protein